MGVWTVIAVLTIIGGLAAWRRIRAIRGRNGAATVTDEMIRAIETGGRVEVDEPLDLEAIENEESRFWEETWDEPEEP
ncbi:MAG: hypothetical protein ACREL7_04660 [Longimicrobiales bacterium]